MNISIGLQAGRSWQEETIRIGAQPAAALQMVRQDPFDMAPETRRMVGFMQMREFMHDDIVEQFRRHMDQPPIQMDSAVRVAGAPAGTRI